MLIMLEKEFLPSAQVPALLQELDEISRMITAFRKTLL